MFNSMGDGHTGIEHKFLKEQSTRHFKLAFSYLKTSSEGGYFIIHATSGGFSSSGLQPKEFLEFLGFEKSFVHCKKFFDACFYKYVYEYFINGYLDDRAVQYAHHHFDKLADDIETLYNTTRDLYRGLGQHVDIFPWASRFDETPKVLDFSGATPSWINSHKTSDHIQVEQTLSETIEKDRHYKTIEYCLWGTGDLLVDSIKYILGVLGFAVSKTEPGSTVDLLAQLRGRDLEFGIEITGTTHPINKSSKKFAQAFSFEQQKLGNRKTLIIANTFCDKPIEDRDPQSFTPEAIEILRGIKGVGMTTFTLYTIWRQCHFEGKDSQKIFEQIFNHPGGMFEVK